MNLFWKLWNSPTFTSWANLVVQLVNMVFIIPLIWKQWGDLELATYFVITAVNRFSYLFADRLTITFSMLVSYVDVGSTDLRPREHLTRPANASGSDAAGHLGGQRDEQLFRRLYGTIGAVLLFFSVTVGSCSAILGTVSIQEFGSKLASGPSDCLVAFWISVGAVALRLNLVRYEILLQGLNQVAVLARWNAVFNAISSLMCVAAVLAGFNIIVWSLIFNGMIVASCLRNVLLADYVLSGALRRMPLLTFDREVFQAAWAPTWRGMIGHVSFVGAEQLCVIVAPYLMSGSDALSFSVFTRLLSLLGPTAQVPFTSQLPKMARLIALNRVEELRVLAVKRIAISCVVLVCGGWALGLALSVLPALLNKEFAGVSLGMWGVFVMLVFHDRFSMLCNATLEAGNKIVLYWQRLLCVICTGLAFWVFAGSLDAAGGVIALYGPRAGIMIVSPLWVMASYVGASPWWIWKRAWLPPAIVHGVFWLILGSGVLPDPGAAKAPRAGERVDRAVETIDPPLVISKLGASQEPNSVPSSVEASDRN